MKDFKEVLVVVNPISGNLEKEETIREIKKQLKEKSDTFQLFNTKGKDDKEQLKKILKNHNIERVIVVGGDGTINLVAEVIKSFNLPLGIIPAGSANGLAKNLKLPPSLKHQVQIALDNNFIYLDLLCLNGIICLHMADLGVNAELIKNYENSIVRGKIGYFLQSFPTLIQSEFLFEFDIEIEDQKLHRQGILLGFANARMYGTGANVNPNGKPDDGIFEVLIFKNFDIPEILKTLRNEVDMNTDFVEIIPARKAYIKCEKPVAFQIDGEYIGSETEIKIEILPEKLKLAVPK